MESTSSEFYFLKTKPEYPKEVRAIAIAHLHYDTNAKRLYFDRPEGWQWVASLWILHESCEVDMAVVLRQDSLDFVEGYCHHGEGCPTVERLKRAVQESEAYFRVRDDIVRELLLQRMLADADSADPPPSQKAVVL